MLFADGRRCQHILDQSAYRWMIDQMRRRLPPSGARFPWWGWYRWEGVRRAKPDLRSEGYLPKGQEGVRIELEMDNGEVLLSRFEDWDYVLNNWFLARDEREDDGFNRQVQKLGLRHSDPRPERLQSKVLRSWERIFDLGIRRRDWRGRYCAMGIQATFWELRHRDVRDVTHFTAR
jgi:hypothetical protein